MKRFLTKSLFQPGFLVLFLLSLAVKMEAEHCKAPGSSDMAMLFHLKHADVCPLQKDTLLEKTYNSWVECGLKCLEEVFCIGYNYKKELKENSNCQLTHKLDHDFENCTNSDKKWTFYQAVEKRELSDSEVTFGQLPIVKRFMKGVFKVRPALPRYQTTWDISKVLEFFRKQPLPSLMCLKDLTVKVTFLLALLSGQRCQTIHLLNIDRMVLTSDSCTFHITEKVKQMRVGAHVKPLEFLKYPLDPHLCVITHLAEYVKRTATIGNNVKQLLLSYVKPFGPVSRDSISRWIKSVLASVGFDVSKFKGHSVRAASTSRLALNNCSMKDIMSSAGWSNESTFQRFYYKQSEATFNFGDAVLLCSAKPNSS